MKAATRREEDIFFSARKIRDAAQRGAFLERACGVDTAMRGRIEQLLEAEIEADEFFEEVGSKVNEALVDAQLDALLDQQTRSADALPAEEPIGARIGRYKLLEKLGEGGCGVVYLAEQEEPVRRRVALKIIRVGMETKSIIARFEAERQALALMDHPNIARVFDAGETERGSPYFVMEVVRGVKITDYCDRNQLDITARLNLFIQVCQAIQHAHQKGVIHGDIKPSNILVSLQDGAHMPKIIDFGISKATEARLTDKRISNFAQLAGTPAYMSPEQADMSEVDIDTRSDIYSLGVLLYELLTGRTPFDGKQLLASGIDEMRRTLREDEPPLPSTMLHLLSPDELAHVAERRCAEPPKLAAELRDDLDWIVSKALEKDRVHRYETANGLGMDVQRRLHNEPVLARPATRVYRLQKLARRNRVVFAAVAAVALALVAGTWTSTWLFLRERDARERAVSAEQQQTRLRKEAEAREVITQAVLLVAQEKYAEADKRLGQISLNQPTVEGASVLRAVGEWYALQNQWALSADRLTRLLQVDQMETWDFSSLDCLRCGPVLLKLPNRQPFEEFRREILARFAASSNPFPDRILKICLIAPATPGVLAALEPIAAATEKSHEQADASDNAFQSAWRALALAVYAYRTGDYEKAIDWCDRCLSSPEPNASRVATARTILALAHRQRGELDQAKAQLDRARELILPKVTGQLDAGGPIQGFWFDWLFADALLREASEQVGQTRN